jgi:hypothetical protein
MNHWFKRSTQCQCSTAALSATTIYCFEDTVQNFQKTKTYIMSLCLTEIRNYFLVFFFYFNKNNRTSSTKIIPEDCLQVPKHVWGTSQSNKKFSMVWCAIGWTEHCAGLVTLLCAMCLTLHPRPLALYPAATVFQSACIICKYVQRTMQNTS